MRFLSDFLSNTYWNSFIVSVCAIFFFFSENKGYFWIKRVISHPCWQHNSVTKHAMFISHSDLDCSSMNCSWLSPASINRMCHCMVHHRKDGAQHKPWSKESQVMQFTSRYSILALFLVQILCAGTRPSLFISEKKRKIFGSGSRMWVMLYVK